MNKLFVYGIFLTERNRQHYGMSNPEYATVRDWVTVGQFIVVAIPCKGATLTGLLVDVEPSRWPEIDRLEGGYDRRYITTEDGVRAYMYVGRGDDGQAEQA